VPHREPQSPDGAYVGTCIILSFELYILPLEIKVFTQKEKNLESYLLILNQIHWLLFSNKVLTISTVVDEFY
jgi:hypothetical protein